MTERYEGADHVPGGLGEQRDTFEELTRDGMAADTLTVAISH